MAPENEKAGYYGRGMGPKAEEPKSPDLPKASEVAKDENPTLEELLNSRACNLLPGFCDSIKDRLSQAEDAAEALKPKDALMYFLDNTKGFYDPKHPATVIGDYKTKFDADDVATARADKRSINFIGELEAYFKKRGKDFEVGKIVIWIMNPDGVDAMKHLAVSKFLDERMTDACTTAGLDESQCMLFHVVAFENSGGVWEYSPKGATGPGQVMSDWFDREPKLLDKKKTENFYIVKLPSRADKKGNVNDYFVQYDGRLDPVSNVEIGARVLSENLYKFGNNHADFAVLAYNQGGDLSDAIKEWVALMKDKTGSSINYKKWFKQHFDKKRIDPMCQFLNYVEAQTGRKLFAADLIKDIENNTNGIRDQLFVKNEDGTFKKNKKGNKIPYFGEDGRGYLSKILAMKEIYENPAKWGLDGRGAETFPVKMDKTLQVQSTWDQMFSEYHMKEGTTLRQYAKANNFDFYVLLASNRQVRDPDAKFDFRVRLWFPKPEILKERKNEFIAEGKSVLAEFMTEKLEWQKFAKSNPSIANKPVVKSPVKPVSQNNGNP